MTVASELARYKLELVGVQEVSGVYLFSLENETNIINLEQDFLFTTILLAIKKVEFVNERISCTVLRGGWCNIIVLNVHAPSDEKSDDSKDSFYEELKQVFDHFHNYHMKILM